MTENYQQIDLATWGRRDYFYYFTKMQPMGFSVTKTMTITKTLHWCQKHQVKFFAAYLYLCCRLLMNHPEFKIIQEEDGRLLKYELLHPSYSLFHSDDQTISNMWTTFTPNFADFYQNYLADQQQFGQKHGAMVKEAPQPKNTVAIGMLPWLDFTSYTPLPFTPLQSFTPVLQAGKYDQTQDEVTMPLSMTTHHAVADGFHVSQFLNELDEALANPADWLA